MCETLGGRWLPVKLKMQGGTGSRKLHTDLSERCVQGSKRGGNPKNEDNREGRMSRKKEDEVLHCRSRHCFKLLNDDHQRGSGCFAILPSIPRQRFVKYPRWSFHEGRTHHAARVEMLASDLFTPSSSSSEVRSDTTCLAR